MITPRITRLVRVPDLQAMHAAVARACANDPRAALASAIIVPTRGAAVELRRTIENRRLSPDAPALVLPQIVTRSELHDALAPPSRLSDAEREVIFRRAARVAAGLGAAAPFRLRPGLIVEILAFYDELRRRNRTIDAFERLMLDGLEPSAGIDRGADRLLHLTYFLAHAFREFERRVRATGRVDEHELRARLIAGTTDAPLLRHLIVTVADQAADPRGLWLADYDLLTRLPGLERIDVIATEHLLASGYHQRIHDLLPGIEEANEGLPAPLPVLVCPEPSEGGEPTRVFVCRDREEELAEAVRDVHRAPAPLDRRAVVFQRPLPYLYLARQVFADAEVPYQALDALPLAAEPFSAALDLVFTFVASEATRASIVDLFSSPHWHFEAGGRPLTRDDVRAASELLTDVKHFGGWGRLSALAARAAEVSQADVVDRAAAAWRRAAPALHAAQAAAEELDALAAAPSASSQLDALLGFVAAHERLPRPGDEWYARHLRARAAVLSAIETLRDAHRLHDDEPVPVTELIGTIRRHVEGQTFAPTTGDSGLRLIDAQAAAYADVDDLRLVGLVESDWPERAGRNIFYPSSLLTQLGWPAEADRAAAARARFRDLLLVARRRLSASTFTLEDDAIVPASAFLEELDAGAFPIERAAPAAPDRLFAHEALSEDPVVARVVAGQAAEWLALRQSRTPPDDRLFHGETGPRSAAVYAVSHVERYLECPFKYFAAHVLKLPEEREDQTGMTPQERGQFLHEVFEHFFAEWQTQGGGAITTANLETALALFARVADVRLATLPEADRALERTYLLGSAAAPGLAERAFTFEIEDAAEVVERLLEHSLEGEFEFRSDTSVRRVRLRAKADRIDLLADGTLRVVDYKLGRAPKAARALQLPIYGVCAEQHLEGRHGRSWTLGRAGYIAFKEKQPFVALGGSMPLDEAVAAGQARLLAAIDGIEAGVFPPDPDEPYMCNWCAYASVCRKDYVGDE